MVNSREVDPADRLESLYEAFGLATVPVEVSISDPVGAGYALVQLSSIGAGEIFQMTGTGLALRRTERHVRDFDYPPLIGFAVQRSRARFSQAGRNEILEHGGPMMVDLSIPFEFGWDGVGVSAAFQAPLIRWACLSMSFASQPAD